MTPPIRVHQDQRAPELPVSGGWEGFLAECLDPQLAEYLPSSARTIRDDLRILALHLCDALSGSDWTGQALEDWYTQIALSETYRARRRWCWLLARWVHPLLPERPPKAVFSPTQVAAFLSTPSIEVVLALWDFLFIEPEIRGPQVSPSGWSWRNPAVSIARLTWKDLTPATSGGVGGLPVTVDPHGRYKLALRWGGQRTGEVMVLNARQERALALLAGLVTDNPPAKNTLMVDSETLQAFPKVIEVVRKDHPSKPILPRLPGQSLAMLPTTVATLLRVRGVVEHGSRLRHLHLHQEAVQLPPKEPNRVLQRLLDGPPLPKAENSG